MFFSSFASGVRSAFSILANLFMANPKPPDIDYLFPTTDLKMPVGPWAKLALIRGGSRDIAKSTSVKNVTHYKSRRGKAHEKLLVELSVPRPESQDIVTTYIITERGPDPDDKRENSDFSTGPSPNPSSASLPQSGAIIHAVDRVVVYGTRTNQSLESYRRRLRKNYDALCTVTPTIPMSLAQLAILMKVVNDHSVEYDIKYQCYWYAYTVWETIRTHFKGNVTENALEGKRGKYMGVRFRREDSVEAITENFETEWNAHCKDEIVDENTVQQAIREVICLCLSMPERVLADCRRRPKNEGRPGNGRDGRRSTVHSTVYVLFVDPIIHFNANMVIILQTKRVCSFSISCMFIFKI